MLPQRAQLQFEGASFDGFVSSGCFPAGSSTSVCLQQLQLFDHQSTSMVMAAVHSCKDRRAAPLMALHFLLPQGCEMQAPCRGCRDKEGRPLLQELTTCRSASALGLCRPCWRPLRSVTTLEGADTSGCESQALTCAACTPGSLSWVSSTPCQLAPREQATFLLAVNLAGLLWQATPHVQHAWILVGCVAEGTHDLHQLAVLLQRVDGHPSASARMACSWPHLCHTKV